MEKKKMPLDWLTLEINLRKWELIPKQCGKICWWDRQYRSLDVRMYFLCFKLTLLFTYK